MSAETLFTWGPSNVTTLLATTESVRGKKVHDNIFTRIPLWYWLKNKSAVKYQGGASVIVPLMYGTNGTATSYNGYDVLNTTPQEGITAAQATWAQEAVTISISGREMMQNMGEEAIISLVDSKFTQAEMSLANQLDIQAFASSQKKTTDLQPVPTIVDTTTTIQNISKSANSWWQCQTIASGSFAAQGVTNLRTLYNTIVNQSVEGAGNGAPDFGIMTQTILESYEATLEPEKRYEDSKMASAGFETLKYKNAYFTFDTNCPSGFLYLLTTSSLYVVIHSSRDFAMTKFIQPTNQDAMVKQLLFMGQIVSPNIRRLGSLSGVTQ